MRLVLEFTAGDGCTWHCDVTLPVEYESGEALLVDFEVAARAAQDRREWAFTFAGHEFDVYFFSRDGTYYPPTVLTVDEWFAG